MVQHRNNRMYGTRLGVIGAVDQPSQARMHQSAGAHRTRFNCSKQLTVSKTMVTDVCPGFAQGDDLSMGSRIGVFEVAVASAAHDLIVEHDYCAYRYLIRFKGALRTAQRFFHPVFI